jgi:molecular chaperone HscA
MLLEIFDPKARLAPIGIDLGTTNSLVARVRDGEAVVIADCNGGARAVGGPLRPRGT